jgi:hypothetical protein
MTGAAIHAPGVRTARYTATVRAICAVDGRPFCCEVEIVVAVIAAAVGAACRDPAGPRAEVSDEDVQRGVEIARQIRQDARRECAEYQEGLRGGGNG